LVSLLVVTVLMAVKPKKIVVSKVTRVALVDEGANLTPGLFKSKEGEEELNLVPIMKSVPEEGLLYGIVYAPMVVDAHGHYMDRDSIKKACHSFGSSGMSLDLMHQEESLDKAKAAVVESFIMNGQDDRFPSTDHLDREIPHEGSWAMTVQLFDEELRKQAREGSLAELSLTSPPDGYSLEEPSDSELALLKSATTTPEPKEAPEETQMTDTTPDEGVLDAIKGLSEVVERLAEGLTKEEAPMEKAVEKKLDLSDAKALRKHRFDAAVRGLQKQFEIEDGDIASLDLDELDSYIEQLEKLKADHSQDGTKGSARKSLRERTVEQPEEVGFEAELGSLLKELAPRHEAANDKALKRSRR